jgi:tRNA A-37 threonylcarbamoyl transferase component Bud32
MHILGKGGFGIVSKKDDETAKKCSIQYASLQKEHRIIKKLKNVTNIIQVYDYDEKKKCYEMEYLKDYKPLNKISWSNKSIEYKNQIVNDLQETIHKIHENNIVHHDIAARNVMINEQTRQIKIIDFGLSHEISSYNKIKCVNKDLQMLSKLINKIYNGFI